MDGLFVGGQDSSEEGPVVFDEGSDAAGIAIFVLDGREEYRPRLSKSADEPTAPPVGLEANGDVIRDVVEGHDVAVLGPAAAGKQ